MACTSCTATADRTTCRRRSATMAPISTRSWSSRRCRPTELRARVGQRLGRSHEGRRPRRSGWFAEPPAHVVQHGWRAGELPDPGAQRAGADDPYDRFRVRKAAQGSARATQREGRGSRDHVQGLSRRCPALITMPVRSTLATSSPPIPRASRTAGVSRPRARTSGCPTSASPAVTTRTTSTTPRRGRRPATFCPTPSRRRDPARGQATAPSIRSRARSGGSSSAATTASTR